MAKAKTEKPVEEAPAPVQSDASRELVQALIQAIEATKPVQKKTPMNRKAGTPWSPKDGSPKLKLRRAMYQHGLKLDPDMLTNEQIELLNKLRPGRFMDSWVKVTRRRDKGIDITYPIKTAAQRLKLVNQYGIRNFAELLARCIEEAENPKRFETAEDE